MKKISILDLLIAYAVIQTLLVGLYRFDYLESLFWTLLPTIIMTSVIIILLLAFYLMKRFLNYGIRKNSKKRRD